MQSRGACGGAILFAGLKSQFPGKLMNALVGNQFKLKRNDSAKRSLPLRQWQEVQAMLHQ